MNKILNYLIEKKEKISFVESITGGKLVSDLIMLDNASKVLSEAFVLYSNETKSKYLNIEINEIEKYGVVSKEIAYEMVKKLHQITGADLCISTTGYATGKSTNHAYFGIYYKDQISVNYIEFDNENSRIFNINKLVKEVIDKTEKLLKI